MIRYFCCFFAIIGWFWITSCQNKSSCDPTALPQLQVTFSTHKKNLKPGVGYVDSLPCFRVIYKISALNSFVKDSAIYQDSIRDSVGITGFKAPVSNRDSVSTYVIVVDSNLHGIGHHLKTDKLRIGYTKRLKFISQGCGYSYVYTIKGTPPNYDITLTHNYFTGFTCIDPSIGDGKENIRLKFNL